MFSGLFLIFPIVYLVNQAMGIDVIIPVMVLIILPLLPVIPVITELTTQEESIEQQKISVESE